MPTARFNPDRCFVVVEVSTLGEISIANNTDGECITTDKNRAFFMKKDLQRYPHNANKEYNVFQLIREPENNEEIWTWEESSVEGKIVYDASNNLNASGYQFKSKDECIDFVELMNRQG